MPIWIFWSWLPSRWPNWQDWNWELEVVFFCSHLCLSGWSIWSWVPTFTNLSRLLTCMPKGTWFPSLLASSWFELSFFNPAVVVPRFPISLEEMATDWTSTLASGFGRIFSKGTSFPWRSWVTRGLFAGIEELGLVTDAPEKGVCGGLWFCAIVFETVKFPAWHSIPPGLRRLCWSLPVGFNVHRVVCNPIEERLSFKKPWLALKACARPGSACPVEPEEGEVCERVTVLSGAGDPELSFIGDTDWLLLLAGEKSSDRDRAGEGVEVPPTEPVPIEEDDPAAAAAARCARANWAFALMSARVRAPVRPGRMLGGVNGTGTGVLGDTCSVDAGAEEILDTGICKERVWVLLWEWKFHWVQHLMSKNEYSAAKITVLWVVAWALLCGC